VADRAPLTLLCIAFTIDSYSCCRAADRQIRGWGVRGRAVSTIIVDRSTLFRSGLGHLLKGSRYRVLASLTGPAELQGVNIPAGPTLFILNVDDAWQGGGKVVLDIKAQHPEGRIVLMGASFASQQLQIVMRTGADACLLTTITFDALIKSLDLIMLGKSVLSAGLRLFADEAEPVPAEMHRLVQHLETARAAEPVSRPRAELSPRERQILQCLTQGESNKAIAFRFCMTESTVKAHMKAILRKIGASNRTQAAIWARQNEPSQSETPQAAAN
jgi:two-component system, NarL family, nitrate/nitrite response regulator NarL